MRILIIDDAKFNLVTLAKVVNLLGYQAVTTTSCKEAIDWLASDQVFDLVLTDFCMPEMNGVDFLKLVKDEIKIKLGKALPPFVMFTAFRDERLETAALKTGFFDILKKPLHQQSLKEITARILAGEHLTQKPIESVVLVSAKGDDLYLCMSNLVAETDYEFVHYDNIEQAKRYFAQTETIKAMFCAYDYDVIDFYSWCVAHQRVCDSGVLPMPPFVALFSNDDFSDKVHQVSILENCFNVGLKKAINISTNPQKIRDVLEVNKGFNADAMGCVLVVEMSSFGRKFLGSLFQAYGVSFQEAGTIEEACQKYGTHPEITLVMTDSDLPDGSAYGLLQQLSLIPRVGQQGPVATAGVVVMGTKALPSIKPKALQQGFLDYLQKPLDKHKIYALIQEHIATTAVDTTSQEDTTTV